MAIALLFTIATPAQATATEGSCPQWHALMRRHHLPVAIFTKLAWRESRCDARSISAVRKSTGRPDVGIWQIQGSWSTLTMRTCKVKRNQVIKALQNPECNAKVASVLWADGKGASNWRVNSGKKDNK
jgi:hypothetical protein